MRDLADEIQDQSLAVTPRASWPSTRSSSVLGLRLQQRLRGQHVLDFAGADAEGQRAERAVRGGVAVAADDGHAGLRQAELRADDVDDALLRIVQVVQRMPNSRQLLRSVSICCLEIGSAIGRRAVGRGHVVVGRGDGQFRPADFAAGQPQAFERLRAGDFVDQVQIDVEDRLLARLGMDDVVVPDFLEHRAGREAWQKDI